MRCGSSLCAGAPDGQREERTGVTRGFMFSLKITHCPSGCPQSRLSSGPEGIHQINTVYDRKAAHSAGHLCHWASGVAEDRGVTGMNLAEGGLTVSVQLWPFCATRRASSSKWRTLSCTSMLHCESSQSPLPSPRIIILHKFCFQVRFFWVYAFSFRFNFDTFLTVPFLLRSFRTRSLWSKTLSIESLASLIWSITSLHLCMFPWNRRHSITWLSWGWMAFRGLFTWQRHSTDNKVDYTIPWNSWAPIRICKTLWLKILQDLVEGQREIKVEVDFLLPG